MWLWYLDAVFDSFREDAADCHISAVFEEHICVPELPFFVCSHCLGMPRATWALHVFVLSMDVISLDDFWLFKS